MNAGQQLLQKKAHKELLESYDKRAQAASGYMNAVRPGLCIQTGALLDPKVCTVPCHAPGCYYNALKTSDGVQAAISIAAGRGWDDHLVQSGIMQICDAYSTMQSK